MDRLSKAQLLLAQASSILKEAGSEMTDDEAVVLLEVNLLIHDIDVLHEQHPPKYNAKEIH